MSTAMQLPATAMQLPATAHAQLPEAPKVAAAAAAAAKLTEQELLEIQKYGRQRAIAEALLCNKQVPVSDLPKELIAQSWWARRLAERLVTKNETL